MADIGRVLVLAGGLSHERDVSLRSGRRVAEALRSVDVDVEFQDVDAGLLAELRSDPPSVVFPVLHGADGEDGALRSVLELLDLAYVGTRPAACRLAFDKPTAKAIVSANTVRTPDWIALPSDTFRELGAEYMLEAVVARLGLPLAVKPARGGSALGVSAVHSAADLPAAMVKAYAYGDTALVERFVTGIEVAVSVLDTGDGPRALPAVEIVPEEGTYDYFARYTAGTTEFFTPARISDQVAAAAATAALRSHESLQLRDVSRTDLVIDADGVPWFLEVNVAPGMTETSLLPQAAEAAGLELGLLYRDLVQTAATRGPQPG